MTAVTVTTFETNVQGAAKQCGPLHADQNLKWPTFSKTLATSEPGKVTKHLRNEGASKILMDDFDAFLEIWFDWYQCRSLICQTKMTS